MSELHFDEAKHIYTMDGIELPSVTTITRFCSYDSINGNGANPFYRERGTKIHELTADYDLTDELPTGTGVDGYLKAYADFKRDYRPKWEYVEYMIGRAELGFAGTLDRVGYIDGQLAILDIKSASKVNQLALTAQLTGYCYLYTAGKVYRVSGDPRNINPDAFLPKLYGLQLQKTGKYRLIPVKIDIDLFKACQTLHKKGLGK